jgi:hypothetical protein
LELNEELSSCFLFFGYFIIMMADEAESTVSGCSTDSSVRFVKKIEQTYRVSLFDRTNLAFIVKDKIVRKRGANGKRRKLWVWKSLGR